MKKFISFITVFCLLLISFPLSATALTDPEITAPSAVLMEANSGKVLFAKGENEVRACASITKVMTLTLVMEALESGQLNLTDILSASEHAASMGGSDIWLKPGEEMSVDDLIKATAVASANDAAVVLAEQIATSEDAFVAQMNQKACDLGMSNTTFKNCNGLDEEGHLTSAYDVALMSRELIKHKKIFDYTNIWIDYLRQGKTQLVNTNKLLKTYSGITGLKTGTTSQAGSCITATAEKNGLSLIAVVLGAKSTTDRFSDAKTLLEYGFSNYTAFQPDFNAEELNPVKVENGMVDEVSVICDDPKNILISKENKNKIKTEISMDESVVAPVEEGQVLGKVYFKVDNEIVDSVDIYSSCAVEEISFNSVLKLLWHSLIKT